MTASIPLNDQAYWRDLGDGLVLRWSTADDMERIADLYSHVFRDSADEPPNRHIATWTRDMFSGRHPLIGPTDFAVVEDTTTDAIVASTCLLSQVWEYEGIPCPAGRPEIVATRESYRNRGLIRAIFELIHARSAALGHIVQGITGIPYYYRQYEYEYALDLGGNRTLALASIPRLKDGAPEPYRLRDATTDDLPIVMRLYDRERSRAAISTRIDEPYWRWMLDGMNPEARERWRILLIVDGDERVQGYAMIQPAPWRGMIHLLALAVEPGVPLISAAPSVLRGLQALVPEMPRDEREGQAESIAFGLTRSHPVYDALGDLLPPAHRPPYAWYVRVPDLPRFILHVAPVLEQRLATSVAAGYSGELTLDFYRGGLRLVFEGGRLAAAEDWRVPAWGRANGGFPPRVFLQLLFGYRSFDELDYAFPDVWARDATVPLLHALFPPRSGWVVPLD